MVPESQVAQEPADSASPPVVLIVDDEPAIRHLVRTNLQHIGLKVIEAEDGVSGLRAVAEQRPDLVILDVMMPTWTASKRWSGSAPNRRRPAFPS